ncbi:DUF1320 domain-containing protein [Budviciaceae bacterium BWR-B9]|uniref:DUF1320 domain-containing protein n=1 Tax=Limnobaculum allomyrinae TaxID=2791986 RepID=A0ABS1IW01_9GAMM|nr:MULTISPECIES: DUF1320 domain-containing protein [Limnobaculum]MBK5145941.1 DUF1320 domain-containing protein [Limnobaculum allomyrinae]MBV7694004.1 DUF1320 domain-containing protein [Limnobaculum sp. M2-1]
MRYCTLNDLERAVPRQTLIWLSNDDPAAESYDPVVLEDAINYAEELADGYLVSRYPLPLSSVPTIVRDAVAYLARYWLYQRRPEGAMPEAVKDGKKDALDTLSQIQKGAISLNVKIADTVAEAKEPGVFKVSASKRFWGSKLLEKWR